MHNLLNTIKNQIDHIEFLINYCPGNSMASAICHDFWLYSALTPIFFVILYLLYILIDFNFQRHALDQLMKRRLARAQVADDEVLNQYKWRGMESLLDDIPQDDLADRLRQVIKSPHDAQRN